MLIQIHTQGSGEAFLPALVVGFRPDELRLTERFKRGQALEGLVALTPQVGGHSTGVRDVYGVMLRLERNADRGRKPLGPMIRALRAMGEDPQYGLLKREFPALLPLTGTSGEPYAPAELKALHEFVRLFLDLPDFVEGIEPLVRFRNVEPLVTLGDWYILKCQPRDGTAHHDRIDDLTLGDFLLTENVLYRDVHAQLLEIGKPHVWLLWENSD